MSESKSLADLIESYRRALKAGELALLLCVSTITFQIGTCRPHSVLSRGHVRSLRPESCREMAEEYLGAVAN